MAGRFSLTVHTARCDVPKDAQLNRATGQRRSGGRRCDIRQTAAERNGATKPRKGNQQQDSAGAAGGGATFGKRPPDGTVRQSRAKETDSGTIRPATLRLPKNEKRHALRTRSDRKIRRRERRRTADAAAAAQGQRQKRDSNGRSNPSSSAAPRFRTADRPPRQQPHRRTIRSPREYPTAAAHRSSGPAAPAAWAARAKHVCRYTSGRCIRAIRH